MRRITLFFAVLAVLALPASAVAGPFVLHPRGFGEHSYSAWKGQEGLPDSTGSKDEALYFQKNTPTPTFAAGVAVFKGFEGMPTSAVSPLAFDYRTDGHCGAGAPRFNLVVENGGVTQTFFFGCNSGMFPGATQFDDQGRLWQRRSTAGPLPPGNVVRLAIVYDEGNDLGFLCPEDPAGSCVFLDNIQVGDHVWTSASDNGQSETSTANSLTLEQLWGAPLETLLAG